MIGLDYNQQTRYEIFSVFRNLMSISLRGYIELSVSVMVKGNQLYTTGWVIIQNQNSIYSLINLVEKRSPLLFSSLII